MTGTSQEDVHEEKSLGGSIRRHQRGEASPGEPPGHTKCGLVEGRGVEPPSLVGSNLRPFSPTLAEGASPLARSPRRGYTHFASLDLGILVVHLSLVCQLDATSHRRFFANACPDPDLR